MAVNGLAAMSASLTDLKGFKFDRYTPGDADVSFDIHYSGICHTVLHCCFGPDARL
jgi:D-arabinose 1-dehydrogenase-like Zn-dependent alcohol dehydrogenase